jgi:hypothetical protein
VESRGIVRLRGDSGAVRVVLPAGCSGRLRALALRTGDGALEFEVPAPRSGTFDGTFVGIRPGTYDWSVVLEGKARGEWREALLVRPAAVTVAVVE